MSLIKHSDYILKRNANRIVSSSYPSYLVYKQFHTGKVLNFKQTGFKYDKITKSILLSKANGKISKFLIHLKWPFIRNKKLSPFELISPFISSFILGNLIWIILGTTTFALCLIYITYYLNSFLGDDSKIVGPLTNNILSFGLGLNLKFETNNFYNNLPEFKDGKIRFKNLLVTNKENKSFVFKGTIEALELTLSFNKWYEGKGLIHNLEIYGLNGELNKIEKEPPVKELRYNESMHYQYDLDHETEQVSTFIDKNYLFDNVKMFDSIIKIQDETPLILNIFNCDLPKLRGDKILVDIFNANNISGAVNNSLFTIHKRQNKEDENKVIRFKLDSIDLSELHTKAFNWLINGKVEITADIKLPKEESLIPESMSDILMNNIFKQRTVEEDSLLKDAVSAIYYTFKKEKQPLESNTPYVIVNFKLKLKDLQAVMPKNLPLSQNNQPFISLTDLRSLIGFINQNEDQIIIKSTVIEKLNNINSLSNLKLFDNLVHDIYEEFNSIVKDDEKRIYHEKSWSQSLATQLLLIGLGAIA